MKYHHPIELPNLLITPLPHYIRENLYNYKSGEAGVKTLTIAHRLVTIENCDEIMVVENGSIKEKGRFAELERYKLASTQHLLPEQE